MESNIEREATAYHEAGDAEAVQVTQRPRHSYLGRNSGPLPILLMMSNVNQTKARVLIAIPQAEAYK